MSLVDLGKRLLEAAKTGQTEEVRALMSNGAPFTTDWLGTSPLHYAALQGHVETAEVLLRAGISRDARTKVDRTPLHAASQEGHRDVVDLLIKNGADIEAKDMLKMTPLHWAVEKGHVGVIELLLGHGSDINVDNKFDKSPVDIAIQNGRNDIAEVLQLSRLPQQNVVEVTTDQTVVEEVAETTNIETLEDAGAPAFTVTDGEGTEQSSTAVLATLAALAEATGPLNSSSTTSETHTTAAEALHWLESHGITMISGDGQTNLVENGQSLSLTEAGKLALDFVKQKVIVSNDESELTAESEDGTPMVIRLAGTTNTEGVSDQEEPMLKKIKLEEAIPEGYILAKTEPDSELYKDTEDASVENIATNVVTDDGGMILTQDGVIVTEEGYVMQEGLDGITVQSDMSEHATDGAITQEGELVEGQITQEELPVETEQQQLLQENQDHADGITLQEDAVGSLLQQQSPSAVLLQSEEPSSNAEPPSHNDEITTEEIHDFEVIHNIDQQVLQVDDIEHETAEGTEEHDMRDELDAITSKT